nr:hypothetical protein [uncultured Hyphomonas sp.]
MFTNDTVVLVGAGASAEFGLPTGDGIYTAAASEDESFYCESDQKADFFLSTFWEFLRFHNWFDEQDQFRALNRHLQEDAAYSIDLYAFRNPSRASIAKLFTAWMLTKSVFEAVDITGFGDDRYRGLKRRYTWRKPNISDRDGNRKNWLACLCNNFLEGASGIDDLAQNRLSIVTFNYDRVIEESFEYFVRNSELFSETPVEYLPEVIHVHGAVAPIEEKNLNGAYIKEQAQTLKFISDSQQDPGTEVLKAADRLANANRIYLVGFACEPLNMSLLKSGQWAPRAIGLNYDGDTGITNNMRISGLKEANIVMGSNSEKLPLGLAASRGLFKQKPKP